VLAPKGLDAARAYASIAPDAEHALHMPSHIFVQIGLWGDTADSNEKAWAASRAWVARRGAHGTEHDFHSLQWLQYAYLQQGRYRMAAALVDSARSALGGTDLSAGTYPDAGHAVGRLEFALAAETGGWEDWRPAEAPALDAEADPAMASRTRFFARSAAYQRAAGAAMRGDADAAQARAFREGDASGPGFPTIQLAALAAGARGDTAGMLAGLAEAAEAEERVPPVGPPSFLPSHELLGRALLDAGRPEEAVAAFERALERRPNRSAALLGLARAHAAAGDPEGAAAAYRQLLANWKDADPDLAALAEALAGIR
jgi:tetratricopeptide (TPR) repeat protein